MFLSGGGVYVHADARRTSVAAAVDFAAAAGLQGVILNTLALQVGGSRRERPRSCMHAGVPGPALLTLALPTYPGLPGEPAIWSHERQLLKPAMLRAPLPQAAEDGGARWVEAARERGLRVMTYGLPNDNPEWVRRQWYLGVQVGGEQPRGWKGPHSCGGVVGWRPRSRPARGCAPCTGLAAPLAGPAPALCLGV